ncbi:MAG: hypothetical protein PWP18_1018 [Thermoanaerobacter sp.]|nr:hypothetical protein [Thermoanaerobacter sp.]
MLNHKMLKYKIFLTLYIVLHIAIFYSSFKYKIPIPVLIAVICSSIFVISHNETVGISAFSVLDYKLNKRMGDVVWAILLMSNFLLVAAIGDYLNETRILQCIQMFMLLQTESLVADTVFAFFVKRDPQN